MLNKFKRLAKESVVYGLGGAGARLFNFLLLPIFTRSFSVANYGAIDIINTLISLAGILLISGTDSALSFYFFKYPTHEERKKTITALFVYILVSNTILALLLWLAAEPVANLILGNIIYARYLRIASLSIPLSHIMTYNLTILRLRRKPYTYIAVTVPSMALTMLLNILLVVVLQVGIDGVFITNAIIYGVFSIMGLIINRTYYGTAFDLHRFIELFKYWIPLAIGGISAWIRTSMDRTVLNQFFTLEQVGIYSAGLRMASMVSFFVQAYRIANLPFLFESSQDEDAPKVYSRSLSYYLIIATLLTVGVSVLAKPILPILTTEKYIAAVPVIPFLTYAVVAEGASQIFSIGLFLKKKTLQSGIISASSSLISLVLLFTLTPLWGMLGTSLAVLLGYLVFDYLLWYRSQKYYPIDYDWKRVARLLIYSGLIVLIGRLVSTENFLLAITIGAVLVVAYIALLIFGSGVTVTEKDILIKEIQSLLTSLRRLGKAKA